MIGGEMLASGRRLSGHERVRVLHVHSGNLYGGLETLLRTIAHHGSDGLVTMDYALCFEGRIANDLRQAGATVHLLGEVRVRSPRRVVAVRRELARLLRTARYDVVVCHSVWSRALFGPVVRKSGARLAYYMHDIPDPMGWLDRWASFTPADLVLYNSEFTETAGQWLASKAKRRRVLHCPLAIHGKGASLTTVRASLGVDAGAFVILQACRMEAWKGHRLLIEALSQLRDDPRWTCWIAGGPQRPSEIKYYDGLLSAVDRLGLGARIAFLGQRDDVPELMGAADLYCQPNIRPEPFGLSFVEALASGLPVVATAMGGALEIVSPSCGRLTAPEPRAVALAIGEYLDGADKRQAAADAGPIRARELCDASARIRELEKELALLARQP